MKRLFIFVLVFALLPVLALAEADPQGVIDGMASGDFEGVYALFDDAVKQQLTSADALKDTWGQIEGMFGAYLSGSAGEASTVSGYQTYPVVCEFESATVTFALAYDADGKLAGLTVADYAMKEAEVVDEGGYVEEPITLRAGEADETSGLLTLPEGEGAFPCVVMMQGSGASDMNEAVGGTKVFESLAHALARAGIASIRYDKYTYAHADLIMDTYATFTVDGEYAYDAQAAVALLDSDVRISSVYLLGHSLGAKVAPRVAAQLESEKLKGMVLLAGTPRPLYEILLRQLTDQGVDAAEIAEYADQFAAMADMSDEYLQKAQVLGASLYYWQDEAAYDTTAKIAELGLPVFIAQGAKDFQVLPAEGIEAYQAALSGYEKATYQLYPDMTHLLFDLTGESSGTATDYAGLDGLNAALAPDIAAWIAAQ